MSIGRRVEAVAANGQMSLGEIREFVAEMDHAGAADTTVPKARVNFKGTLKSLTADAVRFGDREPELVAVPGDLHG